MEARKKYELHYLPLPGDKADVGRLTKAGAIAWLDDWASDWTVILSLALGIDDSATRSAYGMLCCDLTTMFEAAAQAIKTGKGVNVSRRNADGEMDDLAKIMRIVSSRAEMRSAAVGPFEDCFEILAADVERRLAAIGANASAAAHTGQAEPEFTA